MITRYEQKNRTWIDVLNPTPEEIKEVATEAAIPADFTHDLTVMIPHSKTVYEKGALKVTLDFPIVRRTDINHPHEIKFIVTKTHLVTIRFEDIEALHRFGKEFEVLCVLENGRQKPTITLFITMLTFLYEAMNLKLDYIANKLKDIEEEIFKEHEKEMVFELSQISRRLISFKQTIAAHEHALTQLRSGIGVAFGKKYEKEVDILEHHYRHLTRQLYTLDHTLNDLRETNHALLSTKQNEIMKIFTILAFITFPLTLFTSVFGMNTVATPIVGNQSDFWIIISVMVVVSIFFFAYFKYKKWI